MATESGAGAGPHWTVTGQVPTQIRNAAGDYTDGWRVTFTTDSGLEDTVEVPATAYNAENVRALIAARVDTHDAVRNLSG